MEHVDLATTDAVSCGCAACCGMIVERDAVAGEDAGLASAGTDRGGFSTSDKPSKTIDDAVLQLTAGGYNWSGRGVEGTPTTVSYGYRSVEPSKMPDEVSGFTAFNDTQIAATELALTAWSDVAGISFARVFESGEYGDNATVLFGNYSTSDDESAGFA